MFASVTDVSPPTPDSASAAAAAQLTTSLMREKDLVPTFNVPDKLFESESENSDSEAVSLLTLLLLTNFMNFCLFHILFIIFKRKCVHGLVS